MQAARSGDRLEALQALRDLLARSLNRAKSGRDIAALSRQLTLVLAQISQLEIAAPAGTPLDELRRRRESRKIPVQSRDRPVAASESSGTGS